MSEVKKEVGIVSADDIRNSIFIIRDKQVILDSDLAKLYKVETKYLNKTVTRNRERFPESFCFQLNKNEFDSLRFQNGTSNNGDNAVKTSIRIMETFVEMRHFIANNARLFDRISDLELKQLKYQVSSDEKFEKIFSYIKTRSESSQKIFFGEQIYDAYSFLASLIKKAKRKLILIDNYISLETLDILSKKNGGVFVCVYTLPTTKITEIDIANFNSEYPTIKLYKTSNFHDRFLILDDKKFFHIGASLKDAGKKCFAVSEFKEIEENKNLLNRIKEIK